MIPAITKSISASCTLGDKIIIIKHTAARTVSNRFTIPPYFTNLGNYLHHTILLTCFQVKYMNVSIFPATCGTMTAWPKRCRKKILRRICGRW